MRVCLAELGSEQISMAVTETEEFLMNEIGHWGKAMRSQYCRELSLVLMAGTTGLLSSKACDI